MRSHVDDAASGETLFSRDCPEYLLRTAAAKLCYWSTTSSPRATGHKPSNDADVGASHASGEIYERRRAEGRKHIAVVGDFNDNPDAATLEPLIAGTDLKDVSTHPAYIQDGRTGTWKTSQNKFDYLLLSPEAFSAVTSAGLNRSGVWHGPKVKNPWTMLNELTKEEQAASDHAAIWADLTF